MTPTIYKIRVEGHCVEHYTVRATSRTEAVGIAESLFDGRNLSISESTIERESPDEGQEVDNDG